MGLLERGYPSFPQQAFDPSGFLAAWAQRQAGNGMGLLSRPVPPQAYTPASPTANLTAHDQMLAPPPPTPVFGAPIEPPPKEGGNGDPNGPNGPNGGPAAVDHSGPVSGIGGSVPTASAMGVPPGGMALASMLGPVGQAIGMANTIGNIANTQANKGMLSQMGIQKGLMDTLKGYLGYNELSKLGVDAINANAKGLPNDVTQNQVNNEIAEQAAQQEAQNPTSVSAPVVGVDKDELGPPDAPDSDTSADSGSPGGQSGGSSSGGPNGGQGGNGDTSTGGYAEGGVITANAIRGSAPDRVDDGWAQVKAGEGVLNQGAMGLLGQPLLNALNRLGDRHLALKGRGLLG